MRTTLVLCALLSAASGLTLRPCGRPTSRRALLAGSLCAAVLPAFAEDAPVPAAAPSRMYQNGLVVPELASEPTVAAAPTLADPDEITYPALTQKIKECMSGACEIEKVEFTSSNGDAGFAIVRGRRLPIRGIPAENPNSDQLC